MRDYRAVVVVVVVCCWDGWRIEGVAGPDGQHVGGCTLRDRPSTQVAFLFGMGENGEDMGELEMRNRYRP